MQNHFKIKVKIFDQIKIFEIKYKYLNYIKNILSAIAVLYILRKTNNLKMDFFKDFNIQKEEEIYQK